MGLYSSIPHQTMSPPREPNLYVRTLLGLYRKISVEGILYHCCVGMSNVLLSFFWRPFSRVMDCWSRRLHFRQVLCCVRKSKSVFAFSPRVVVPGPWGLRFQGYSIQDLPVMTVGVRANLYFYDWRGNFSEGQGLRFPFLYEFGEWLGFRRPAFMDLVPENCLL